MGRVSEGYLTGLLEEADGFDIVIPGLKDRIKAMLREAADIGWDEAAEYYY